MGKFLRPAKCRKGRRTAGILLGILVLCLMAHGIFRADGPQGESAVTSQEVRCVRLYWRGEAMDAVSEGESVGALLARLGLELTESDRLSHSLYSLTYDGMVLRVDSVTTRQEVYTRAIPHGVQVCRDSSAPRGTERILTRGRDGELLCTAQVTYINGAEVSRQVTDSRQTIAPVTEILARGTGAPPSAAVLEIGGGYIRLPTGEVLTYTRTDTVRATAYTHTDAGCNRITATGTQVRVGTVAVDPRFIPYGTRMFIVSNDGEYVYGLAVAEDCGGAIKRDRMDLYFPTYEECMEFGFRSCTIYFLG